MKLDWSVQCQFDPALWTCGIGMWSWCLSKELSPLWLPCCWQGEAGASYSSWVSGGSRRCQGCEVQNRWWCRAGGEGSTYICLWWLLLKSALQALRTEGLIASNVSLSNYVDAVKDVLFCFVTKIGLFSWSWNFLVCAGWCSFMFGMQDRGL